jgi:hypothetical protein
LGRTPQTVLSESCNGRTSRPRPAKP